MHIHVAVQFMHTYMEWNIDLGSRSLRPLNSYRQTPCSRQTFQLLILNDYLYQLQLWAYDDVHVAIPHNVN